MTPFAIGALLYGTVCAISYTKFQTTWIPYVAAGCIGIGTNLTWMWVAQHANGTSDIMVKGILWDSMIKIIYVILPILVFKAELTMGAKIGLALIIIGSYLVKY